MQNKPLLSISVLVSNRIDTIRKCMESIKPLLTGFPCELVAIDTVGEATDGSIDVVREYTDKVYHFEWCNDFARARNFGLKKCSGEWFMFMDDDEWFEDVTEIIEFFTSGEYKNYNCANYKIRSYRDYEGDYSVASLFRMVKVEVATRFEGRVHEHLTPLREPAKEFSSYAHHYGYVFDKEEEKIAHSKRNISLLEPDFEKNPWNMHVRAQLLQEYIFLPELIDRAEEICKETLQADKELYKTNEFQWCLYTYVKLSNKKECFEEVVDRAEFIRNNYPLNAMADIAISALELNAYHKLGNYENAIELLERIIDNRKKIQNDLQMRQRVLFMDFVTFLENGMYSDILRIGICCCQHVNDMKKAEEWTQERFKYMSIPVLTISVLVSKCKETVRKCLDSIKPLLDVIPSELIIVDTIGEENSNGSLAVAKEYTNKIVSFTWCDDFAAARNAGLKVARGEWFLYLDDDEWFENVNELIRFFASGEYLEYNSATYKVRNYKDAQSIAYTEATVGRMIRRAKKSEFVGCVNETFNMIYTPCKTLSSYVHHFGFVYVTPEAKKARMEYTFRLLHKDLEVYPRNLRNRLQLAIVLSAQNPEQAVALCEETLQLCQDKKGTEAYQKVEQLLNSLYAKRSQVKSDETELKKEFQWQLFLGFRSYETTNSTLKEAEESYQTLKAQYGFNETTENSICYQMTRICILKDEPEKGYPYAKKYFETLSYLQQNPKIQQLQMTAEFLKYQAPDIYLEMLHFGAYCAFKAKAYEDAWDWYDAMPWETTGYSNEEGFSFALQMFRENANQKTLLGIVKRIMQNSQEVQKEPVKKKLSEALSMIKRTAETGTAGPDWIKSDIKLTIGILVSNNVTTIRNCMESLKPILEAVNSELIVVDTVGEENSDGSLAIAKEYASKVVRFEWCNDFAAARNVCIDHARGEWFLYVDDDEWFDDVKEIIDFFNSGECEKYGQAMCYIRNYTANGKFTTAVIGRFYRRTIRTRFVGRIHETLQPVYTPAKLFSTFMYHTGYAYTTEIEKKKHQERNVSLLWEELNEKGHTPYICAQIAQELLHVKDTWNEGYAFCQKVIPILVEEQGTIKDASTQWILVATARYFSMINDYEGLFKQVKYLKENYALLEMSKMFLAALVTEKAWSRKDYALVESNVAAYLESRNWLDEHPEQALQQSQLDFGNFYTKEILAQILHIGAMCANLQEKYELANTYWKRFPWDQEELNKADYLEDMNRTMSGLKELQVKQKQREKLKELLPLLQAVKDAENCVRSFVAKENYTEVPELLSGMQEVAITVGTSLDQLIGEDSEEVSLLETYCELVWQCNNAETREEMLADLEQLQRITDSVTEKIDNRL